MEYKYKGEIYDIVLNDEGKIACYAFENPIVCNTPDEVKAAIRGQAKKYSELVEESIIVDRYGYEKATTKWKRQGRGLWVVINGERKHVYGNIYKDSPENWKAIEKINEKRAMIEQIENEILKLEQSLIQL